MAHQCCDINYWTRAKETSCTLALRAPSRREQHPSTLLGLAAVGTPLLNPCSWPCAIPGCPSPGKSCLVQAAYCLSGCTNGCPCCFLMSPHGWDGPVGFWRCEWPWKTRWFSLSAFALIALVHHRLFDLGADVCTGPDKYLKTWSSAHGSYRVCMLWWQCMCCASTSIILEVKHDLGVGEEWDFLFLSRPWSGGCGTGMWHTHGDLAHLCFGYRQISPVPT